MRTAMLQMAGVFSQLERGMIVARLRRGRAAKRDAGGKSEGQYRFGLDSTGAPDADEQAALKLMQNLRAEGRSLREIAAALDAAGHRPRRSDRWHANTVRTILQRADRVA
jgi:DNA invertase Pin-like site-specific DNA recombinase